jgi:hypothetical protein
MREMVNIFPKNIGDERQVALFEDVRDAVALNNPNPDIEAILSVVNAISRDVTGFQLGYPTAYLVSKVLQKPANTSIAVDEDQRQIAKGLEVRLQEMIRRACTPVELEEGLPEFFEPLLKFFDAVIAADPRSAKDLRPAISQLFCPIYTTNYDQILERVFLDRTQLYEPFVTTAERVEKLQEGQLSSQFPRLLKLHGSVDWYRRADGSIVRLPAARRYVGRHKIEGQVMLYPVQQKELYFAPWIWLLKQFQMDLSAYSDWIFVGYSFQDEVLREIVREALKFGAHRLLVLHPRATDVTWWVDSPQEAKLVCVNSRMEADSVKSELAEALSTSG